MKSASTGPSSVGWQSCDHAFISPPFSIPSTTHLEPALPPGGTLAAFGSA